MVSRRRGAVIPGLVLVLALLPATPVRSQGPAQEVQPAQGAESPQGVEPAADVEPPRRLLLFFQTADTARISSSERLLLYESLLVKVGRASDRIAVLEYEAPEVPATGELRSEAAESRRADSWLLVSLDGAWPQLTVRAEAYDLPQDGPAFQLSFSATLRRGAVELERHFWDPITEAAARTFTGRGTAVARTVSREQLVVKGVPGTKIRGLGDGTREIGNSGEISLEVLLPATFSLRATRLGYVPIDRDYLVEPGRGVFDLAQERGSRWAFSFYLQMMNYPGFDAAFYPVPDFYWVKLGFNTFLIGLVLAEDRDKSMVVSYSLSNVNLSTGVYLNAADRLFRFYAGLGVFLRVITARDWAFAVEPIAPFGFYPVLGTEISRGRNLRAFVEYTPPFYVPTDATLFRLSLPLDSGPPILPIPLENPRLFWEVFVFRVGVRWLL
jgi:hypothetical protein